MKTPLIKCAKLLNAREPKNAQEIQNNLNELYFEILHKAKAKNKTADLIRFSKSVRDLLVKLRKYVKSELENIILVTELLDEVN